MKNDLFSEGLFPLSEAVKLLPRRRGGRPVHVSTIFRWAQVGIRGVRLEVVQAGGTKCTSRAAISRFFQHLASPTAAPKKRTEAERERASKRAERTLKNN